MNRARQTAAARAKRRTSRIREAAHARRRQRRRSSNGGGGSTARRSSGGDGKQAHSRADVLHADFLQQRMVEHRHLIDGDASANKRRRRIARLLLLHAARLHQPIEPRVLHRLVENRNWEIAHAKHTHKYLIGIGRRIRLDVRATLLLLAVANERRRVVATRLLRQ